MKKNAKRLLAVMMAAAMVLAMAVSASAINLTYYAYYGTASLNDLGITKLSQIPAT